MKKLDMKAQSIVSARSILLALLCLSSALVSLTEAQDDTVCDQPTGTTSTCMCQTASGQIIDLSPLAHQDGTAKFTGLKSIDGYTYDYNPCTPFTEGDKCKNVFMCQTVPAKGLAFTAADGNEQIFKEASSGKYYIKYSGPENRDTKVYLNCDQCNRDGTVTSVDDDVPNQYVLQLDSCHACPGGCRDDTSHKSGWSVQPGYMGIVLIVVIIAALVIYFIIGALMLKFGHSKVSDTNKNFWIQQPLLINVKMDVHSPSDHVSSLLLKNKEEK